MLLVFNKGSKIPFFVFAVIMLIGVSGHAQLPVLPRIPMTELVENIDTTISVFQKKQKKIKPLVQALFVSDKLDHEFSKAYDISATFEKYWSKMGQKWFLVDLDGNKVDELIFSGAIVQTDPKEYIQIYIKSNSTYKQVFWDDGHFAGFVKHPNTKEIILVHHRYPCCYSASHNINKMRLVQGEFKMDKRLLLARDQGMKGSQFFPKKSTFESKIQLLKKEMPLYWSAEVIDSGAFAYSEKNQVSVFPAGTSYQVLSRNGRWVYVMVLDAPPNLPSNIINPANLTETKLMGWFLMQ